MTGRVSPRASARRTGGNSFTRNRYDEDNRLARLPINLRMHQRNVRESNAYSKTWIEGDLAGEDARPQPSMPVVQFLPRDVIPPTPRELGRRRC
jgi:hypothetical protein